MKQSNWDDILDHLLASRLNPKIPMMNLMQDLKALKTDNHLIKGHSHTITAIRISLDGYKVYSAALDRTLRVWKFNEYSNEFEELQKLDLESEDIIEHKNTLQD